MSTSRKRICSIDGEGENVMAESSYAKLKFKMNKYESELAQLQMELLDTQKTKGEVELALEKVRIEQQATDRSKRGCSKAGETSYSKLKVKWKRSQEELAQVHIVLQETHRLKTQFEAGFMTVQMDLVKLRMELHDTQRNEGELASALHLASALCGLMRRS
jgi:hypothetical protein